MGIIEVAFAVKIEICSGTNGRFEIIDAPLYVYG